METNNQINDSSQQSNQSANNNQSSPISVSSNRKAVIIILLAVLIIAAAVLAFFWLDKDLAFWPNSASENQESSVVQTGNRTVDFNSDTSRQINQQLNTVNVENIDAAFKDIDTDLNSL